MNNIVSYRVIGRNIRKARNAAGLTQDALAQRIGLSQLHTGRLERGERNASIEQLAEIAGVLNISALSLLKGSMPQFHEVLPPLDKESEELGRHIAFLSEGCSPGALLLMRKICETIVQEDKFPTPEEEQE